MKNSRIRIAKSPAKSRLVRAGLLALIVFGFLVIPPEAHARIYVRIGPPAPEHSKASFAIFCFKQQDYLVWIVDIAQQMLLFETGFLAA